MPTMHCEFAVNLFSELQNLIILLNLQKYLKKPKNCILGSKRDPLPILMSRLAF